jgi:replicative superfamily II helicase
MVKFCPNTYPQENESKWGEYFAQFPFPLSSFQKWSIQAIVEGQHVLTCAHTGSGKTLPAEFAITHFAGLGKKVIYCSPIKALSNQKYHDFTTSPANVGISFGLITGDIKTNPDAQVLIMTTEILLNKLNRAGRVGMGGAHSEFDVNISEEVGCVIFDEVHYINDEMRGKVWEETIMLLPVHIQLVMLSATLESPEKFAAWCEDRVVISSSSATPPEEAATTTTKEVYLTVTSERIVPLTHYSFITCSAALLKLYGRDKEIETRLNAIIDKPQIIKTPDGIFCNEMVDKINATLRLFDLKNYRPTRQHVINQVCKYMVEEAMFPAICFVYSRKQVETMAKEVETVLLEDDSKVRYNVHAECEAILRKALPNEWREYTSLPEYQFIISLLEKGVAIHHAGLLSTFREMIEIVFSRGHVKLLFATETFSVGINMPTKTVLFTSLEKFDGSTVRQLLPHEYNQQSGRAGRRGKDTIGHVIHLTNLWDTGKITNTELRHIMQGTPQRLSSKFCISYSVILNQLSAAATATATDSNVLDNLDNFIKKTMLYKQTIVPQINTIQDDVVICERLYAEAVSANNDKYTVSRETIAKWIAAPPTTFGGFAIKPTKAKKRTAIAVGGTASATLIPSDADIELYKMEMVHKDNLTNAQVVLTELHDYIKKQIVTTLEVLGHFNLCDNMPIFAITPKGTIGSMLHELHCVAFPHWFLGSPIDGHLHRMQGWDVNQIVAFLSIFTDITPTSASTLLLEGVVANRDRDNLYIKPYVEILDEIKSRELRAKIFTGTESQLQVQTGLVNVISKWCDATNKSECNAVLAELQQVGISLGEFVKAVLKINNMASELEGVAEYLGDVVLLEKLKQIPFATLKFICTNQSLYL